VKCPNCGATFRGGRGRCPACGYRVQAKKLIRRCPECGARVAEGATTCLICGESLREGKGLIPRVSLSMVPPAPLLGVLLAIVLIAVLWVVKPWRAVQLGVYNTPTATLTSTATATSTSTPTSTPTAPPTETSTPVVTTYIVRSGDTLGVIASQFGVTVQEIMSANNLGDAMIQVGQELLIPLEEEGTVQATQEAVQTPGTEETPAAQSTTYVVQAGDVLGQIAERFNVSLAALMQANGITNPDELRVGQQLTIPGIGSSTETPGIGGPPTPTVRSRYTYPAPVPLGPPDQSEFRDEDAEGPILLNWLSVGLLAEDEWYSVTVRYAGEDEETSQEIVDLVKSTSYRVPGELRPPREAETHQFEWQIAVVRLVDSGSAEDLNVVPISAQSRARSFTWH
jgi:LysM repeat protein